MIRIKFISTSCKIALRGISENTFDVKSALVRIWWLEAHISTWHLLNVIIFVIYHTGVYLITFGRTWKHIKFTAFRYWTNVKYVSILFNLILFQSAFNKKMSLCYTHSFNFLEIRLRASPTCARLARNPQGHYQCIDSWQLSLGGQLAVNPLSVMLAVIKTQH